MEEKKQRGMARNIMEEQREERKGNEMNKTEKKGNEKKRKEQEGKESFGWKSIYLPCKTTIEL